MIPTDRPDVLDLCLAELAGFGQANGARGRFVALYLGLRLMRDRVAKLGSATVTPAGEIEHFLDHMYTKTNRDEPFVVLTAPFGGSTSPTAPYSSHTGEIAPGHRYPTNTWRNNFNIQKGIGCPAAATTIADLLRAPTVRLACPHMAVDTENRYMCGLLGTSYRGEEHSIWLRMVEAGYQTVDLNEPLSYAGYLQPGGQKIPIFPLIGALYALAPLDVYPVRTRVGIADFAHDFGFSLEQVESLFDVDETRPSNSIVVQVSEGELVVEPLPPATVEVMDAELARAPDDLPDLVKSIAMNSGIGAEIAVAKDLARRGWSVRYRGRQRSVGYDLEAVRDDSIRRVEVKSSVSFADLTLLPSEWHAAQRYGEEFVLAVVDFFGSDGESIWYVRDPAGTVVPGERTITTYVIPRPELADLRTEPDFL